MARLLVVTPPGPKADQLTGQLADKGYTVSRAATGSEALPAALRSPPDVILMDSSLSAMDRWHAVKRLNAETRTSRIPVLTISAESHSPAGIQRVLDKLDQTLGPARVNANDPSTPVSSSTRVAASAVAVSSHAPARKSTPPAVPERTPVPTVEPSMPPGSVPPVRRTASPDAAREKVSKVRITRRADPLDNGRILVVDDNDLNRDMLSRRLHRRGYTVESVEDGEAALAAVARSHFDLILLDWMMPGLSGLEVLKRLREQHTSVQLPVIMATAKTEADDIVQALRAEANDYVTKPLNFDVVHARIRTQLSLVRAHQDLLASERRYRALLENTGDMIVQYTLDGTVLYVSPACETLLGLSPDEVRKRGWFDMLHPIDRRELLSQSAEALPSNFTYIARMGRADGAYIWVETSCRLIRDPKTGEVDRIQAAARDVTEHIERITGDEPPLPLGGDIMAHPGWRSSTGSPAPERGASPVAPLQSYEPTPKEPPTTPSAPVPLVLVSALPGQDAVVLSSLSNEEIGDRVAAALRDLVERTNG